jgi:4,5-DOPA dioxygenase extradiol
LGAERRKRQPACFVGHGLPALLMDDADPTNRWLRGFGQSLADDPPEAVLCISSHFVSRPVSVTTGDSPPILHDHDCARFNGIGIPIRGNRDVARRVIQCLLDARLDVVGDDARGIDHAAWMPLSLMFPDHGVPVIQLSLHAGLEPEMHLAMGRALEPLRDNGVLILGSGGLTYDTTALTSAAGTTSMLGMPESSRRFQSWVLDLVTRGATYTRGRGLARFRDHPDTHVVHPQDEHFMPLLVVVGAASGDRASDNVGKLVHAGDHKGLSTAALLFRR